MNTGICIDKNISFCETNSMFGLGDVIRKLRMEKGLTLDQVHDSTGLSKTTLSKIERGGNFERHTLEKLASGLKVSVSDIYARLEESQTPKGDRAKDSIRDPGVSLVAYACTNPDHAIFHRMLENILNSEDRRCIHAVVAVLEAVTSNISPRTASGETNPSHLANSGNGLFEKQHGPGRPVDDLGPGIPLPEIKKKKKGA